MNYYHIEVFLKNNRTPLKCVREFQSEDERDVYKIVEDQVLRQHNIEEIQKIDVWLLASWSEELHNYLVNKKSGKSMVDH